MQYISTRGQAPPLGFCDTLLAGLAIDGGLYVPKSWPILENLASPIADYWQFAATIMHPYVGDEIPRKVFEKICRDSYSEFRLSEVVPLIEIEKNEFLLELFHGPTLAFKDIALQLVGRLFDHVLASRNERVMIVGATSGDTGSAAFRGVADCSNVDIVMLFPHRRISEIQRRQMTTVQAPNVHPVAVEGTFDDCQDLVKAMFVDQSFRENNKLAAVNSINWARIMAQIVYYVLAVEKLRGVSQYSPIFSVPTGNFGNVYAGWVAKKVGAPINGFIVATNENDILYRFLTTRSMNILGVVPTLSPSMDIQVSSNFERLLFEINNRDFEFTAKQLDGLRLQGELTVAPDIFESVISGCFAGQRVDDSMTLRTMADVYTRSGRLIDPHTAVGLAAARAARNGDAPIVTLATAHPAKFPEAVFRATGAVAELPDHLADILDRQESFTQLPNDLEVVKAFVASRRT